MLSGVRLMGLVLSGRALWESGVGRRCVHGDEHGVTDGACWTDTECDRTSWKEGT